MNGHPNGGAAPTTNGLASGRGQMDINMLYQKLNELSELLKNNREKTQGLVASAEAFAGGPATDSANDQTQEDSTQKSTRIAELTRENVDLRNATELLVREQRENGKLLGEYEQAVGDILEKTRNLNFERECDRNQLSKESNQFLQKEKDAHLKTRLERDEWHSLFLQSVDMLRKAHRLRSEEDSEPIQIIAGLQNEVRAYRLALGLPPELLENEAGYDLLKSL